MYLNQRLLLFALMALLSPLQLYCQKSLPKKPVSTTVKSEIKNEDIISWHANFNATKEGQYISVAKQLVAFQGAVTKNIAFQKGVILTKFSADGSKFCVVSDESIQVETDRDKILALQFYSNNSKLIFEMNYKHFYDEPMPEICVLSENQGFILGNSAVGKLQFYDIQGRLNRELTLFPSAEFDLERILKIKASKNGIIAVLATKRSASPMDSGVSNPSGEPTLFVFSNSGNELWRQQLPEFTGGEITISSNGKCVLASSYSSDSRGGLKRVTTLFNAVGEKIESYDFLFQSTASSIDREFLLMADRHTIKAIELHTGKQLWQHKIKREYGLITAAQIGHNMESFFVLVGKDSFKDGAFIFIEPKLVVLNQQGKSQQTMDFPDRVFVNPSLYLAPNSATIGVGFKDAFLTFEVSQ